MNTLASFLTAVAAEVADKKYATSPTPELQALMEPLTRTHESTPASLSDARAAAAAVGLSATIDRKRSIIVFRALHHWSEESTYIRISGLVKCSLCGYVASDHPPVVGAECLTAMCEGIFVKL